MIISLLSRALMMSTPLMLGSIAEVIAERSGMMVTAIEGIFLVGAWGGFVGTYLSGSAAIGLLMAMACGLFVAVLYGCITIFMRQHQVVTGTALNILAAGFCTYFQRGIVWGSNLSAENHAPSHLPVPLLSDIPVIGPIFFNQNILTYIIYIIIPLAYFMLYKTSVGLTIRSTGENPEAVDVAGSM